MHVQWVRADNTKGGGWLSVGVPTPNLLSHAKVVCQENRAGNFRRTRGPCELHHPVGVPLFLCDMASCN